MINNKFKVKPDENILNLIFYDILGFKSYQDKSSKIFDTDLFYKNIITNFKININNFNMYLKKPIDSTIFNSINDCIKLARLFINTTEYKLLHKKILMNGIKKKYYYISNVNINKIKKTQYIPKIISFD